MTRRWWGLLAVSAVVIVGGLLLRWPEFFAMGIGGLALACAPYFLRFPRRGSWRDVATPQRVTRGDDAHVSICIEEVGGSTRWVSAVGARGSDRTFVPEGATPMTMAWPVNTRRRGIFLVGPTRLEAGDPFGLMRRTLATRQASPVIVVPRVYPVEVRLARARADADDTDDRAGSETFHSLREYVPGDPQKLIHWRSSARTGKLMVRRMVDSTVPWMVVILDVNVRAYDRPGAMFEDFDAEAFERAVERAASWSWHGCGRDQRVLLATTALPTAESGIQSVEVTPRNRESSLDALALVDPLPSISCGPGVAQALLHRQGVAHAVFVTGPRTEHSAAWIGAWRRQCAITVLAAD